MVNNAERSGQQFLKALVRLEEVMQRPYEQDQIVVDAAIQRFEFTIELCWKTLKDRLRLEGIQASTPRAVMQEAYAVGWFEDETLWLNILRIAI